VRFEARLSEKMQLFSVHFFFGFGARTLFTIN